MTLALLCSGQGPQHPAMFAVTGDAPAAAPLFDRAAALLDGRDPRALVRDADVETLHGNRVGQVLCTLQAVAALAALPELARGRRIVLGYSVGEVAAWAVAGLVAPDAALDLAVARAAAMDAASHPGDGLLFVRGLPRDAVDRLCGEHGGAVAIVNPGDAVVLGGSADALAALDGAARAAGAGRDRPGRRRGGVAHGETGGRFGGLPGCAVRGRGETARAGRRAAAQRDRRRPGGGRRGRARQAGPAGLDDDPLGRWPRRGGRGGGRAPSSNSGPAAPWPRWPPARIPACRRAASTISSRPTACGTGWGSKEYGMGDGPFHHRLSF